MLYFVFILLNVVVLWLVYDTYAKLTHVNSSLGDMCERLKKLESAPAPKALEPKIETRVPQPASHKKLKKPKPKNYGQHQKALK